MAQMLTDIQSKLVKDFCLTWKIREFSLFGSALRDDFTERSDIDIMVSFRADAAWSLLDHVAMRDELSNIMGRDVDLVTRNAVERSRNSLRRNEILESARVLYAEP